MPGDKKHHTEKFRSCVEKVVASGKAEDSAYAICTTSLQDAGEPIFEGASSRGAEEVRLLSEGVHMSLPRHLHLLGATGQPRTEMWNNREYLVVPCVSLMEGVIHAVNAATPEFVPFATLEKAAKTWEGKPVMLGHPKKNGKQCSADSLDVLEAHGIGVIRNSRVDAKSRKMLQEAWIEKSRVKKLHPEMLARLEANEHEEVSVGAFVVTDGKEGKHSNGREYKASWIEAAGDHLAFLPGGRGACSLEMGCGAHRAAMHLVCAEAIEVVPLVPVMVLSTLEGQSLDDLISAVNVAVNRKWGNANGLNTTGVSYAYAQQVFDDRVIVRKDEDRWSVPYTVNTNGEVVFGEPTKVKQVYVAAEVRVAAGARNSARDTQMIQEMHDSAVSLGAQCDRGNYEMAAQKMVDCPACEGNGSLKGNPCQTCDGSGEVPAKAKYASSSVRHEGGLWVLYSTNGSRRLATHSTKEDAEAQEQAIARSLARQKES